MRTICSNCPQCGVPVEKELRYFNQEIKRNPQYKQYCSPKCRNYHLGIVLNINCDNCQKEFNIKKSQFIKSKLHYCSNSCATTNSNKYRNIPNINLACSICKNIFNVKYNTTDKFKCTKCLKKQRALSSLIIRAHKCILCKSDFSASGHPKYCSTCLLVRQQQYGCKSAANRKEVRRSKNELYFYELCLKEYSNVTSNTPFFDGWDADVLLHDQKIAVLWNGPWHYKECGGKHSLKQTQARDKIKLSKIIEAGWQSYVIKDYNNPSHGKYSASFVEEQFSIFKRYIKLSNLF